MIIEYEEKDQKFIDKVNDDLNNNESGFPLPIYEKGRRYFFEFECTDVAKANLFARLLMCDTEDGKRFQEMCGIDVKALNFCHGDNKISTLKSYLQNFINQLDTIN